MVSLSSLSLISLFSLSLFHSPGAVNPLTQMGEEKKERHVSSGVAIEKGETVSMTNQAISMTRVHPFVSLPFWLDQSQSSPSVFHSSIDDCLCDFDQVVKVRRSKILSVN